jgi:dihydrofolate synthase / folylpolyglutamate synthase
MSLMTIKEINTLFDNRHSSAYSRINFDAFLKQIKFTFKRPAIHITGTNGKGSTATFIKNIYQAARYRVGLFISPSLETFSQMVYVNNDEISEKYIVKMFEKYNFLFDQFNLTTFEIQTFIALSYLQDSKVDIAIVEVGMGGSDDSTNIFNPVLSIITNIAIDHTRYLGKTLGEIAYHKAGIIKEKCPVLIGKLDNNVLKVIEKKAEQMNTKIFKIGEPFNLRFGINNYFSYGYYKDLELSIPGIYQINNASLAIEAIEVLKKRFPVKEKSLRTGLMNTFMPGRLEIMATKPKIILDGAHNVHAVKALVRSISMFKRQNVYILFAAFKDKDVITMLEELKQLSNNIILTTFNHYRARTKEEYNEMKFPFIEDYHNALQSIYKTISSKDIILITGSLAFVAEVRKYLNTNKL